MEDYARLFERKKGVGANSPKDVIKLAYQHGLIEFDELWLKMCDWRNEIVHVYDEHFSDFIYEQMKDVHKVFVALQQSLQG